ncbi:hypothetical protein C1H76_5508 [Elsinoe australis]|uniref:Uncharacterized protein n=1 Tax=Elsinoe australis TaxID=40998 RepID=A0A4U7AVP0_9PEZI|nr:hypothetical protein C1H76_5508 [Elsinoe australis]
MEGAAVWDRIPTIVIKAVCDYADSHKNEDWQKYAAAVAAAGAKALLDEWMLESFTGIPTPDPVARTYHFVQFQRNERFVDRGNVLGDLEEKLLTGHDIALSSWLV